VIPVTLFIALIIASIVFGIIGLFRKPTQPDARIHDRKMEVDGSTIFYHEDDYCQIQLLPNENYSQLVKEIENISESSKSNFDGYGYENIVVRTNERIALATRRIKKKELEELISELKVERHSIVSTGYGFNYRIQSKNTIGFGKEPFGIFYEFNEETEVVENIWLTNPRQLEFVGLPSVISKIAKRWNLVLIDWNSLTLLDWKNLAAVDKYFKTMENIACHNLTLLLKTEKNCLHKSKFQNIDGSVILNSQELIEYMLKEDLIETEKDPDIYFLTEYGYTFADVGVWPKPKYDLDSYSEFSDTNIYPDPMNLPFYKRRRRRRMIAIIFLVTLLAIALIGIIMS